jgi:hypothetical protein
MESRPGCGTAAEGARTQAVIPPAPTERQYALHRRPLAVAAIAAGAAVPQDCTRADSSQILDLFIPKGGTAAPWILPFGA